MHRLWGMLCAGAGAVALMLLMVGTAQAHTDGDRSHAGNLHEHVSGTTG